MQARAFAWARKHRGAAITLGVLAVLVIAILWRTASFASEASARFTELAHEANARGDHGKAVDYGLAALNGQDAPLIGFNGDTGRTELLAAIVGSRRIAAYRSAKPESRYDSVAFSPSGARIIAQATFRDGDGEFQHGAQIWDAATGAPIGRISWGGEGSHATSAAIAPDDQVALTADSGGRVRLWNIADGAMIKEAPRRLSELIGNAAFSPDGARVVASDNDGVYVWDVASDSVYAFPVRHCGASSFSADGALVASVCLDGRLRVWRVEATGALELAKAILLSDDAVYNDAGVAFSADGALIAAALWTETTIWNWREGRRVATLTGAADNGNDRPSAVYFDPSGARLLTSVREGEAEARIWNVDARREAAVLQWKSGAGNRSVAWNADASRVVTATGREEIHLWDGGGEPDPDRLVSARPGEALAPLSSLGAGALRRYACERALASDGPNGAMYDRMRDIDASVADDVCASRFWSRIGAALGFKSESLRYGQTFAPPNVAISYRVSGRHQMDVATTMWIEGHGARMARRDRSAEHTFEFYWDGVRTFWRVDGQPTISVYGFLEPDAPLISLRHQPSSFVPGLNFDAEGRAWRRDGSYKGPDGDERVIAGVNAKCFDDVRCYWREILVREVRQSTLRDEPGVAYQLEAVEIEEGGAIPAELKALAQEGGARDAN